MNSKIASNKSYGIIFFVFFLILALYPLFYDKNIKVWFLIIALIFLTLGLINSYILSPLNKIWFEFGVLLGNFISPIIMGLVFFAVVTPTSFIMKVFGKNLLNLKRTDKKSYWIEKSTIKSKMKNQF